MKTTINLVVLVLTLISTTTIKASFNNNANLNDLAEKMSKSKSVSSFIQSVFEINKSKSNCSLEKTKLDQEFTKQIKTNKNIELIKENRLKMLDEFPILKIMPKIEKIEIFKILINKFKENSIPSIFNPVCFTGALLYSMPNCIGMSPAQVAVYETCMSGASMIDLAELVASEGLAFEVLLPEFSAEMTTCSMVATEASTEVIFPCLESSVRALRACL